jgi:hypothetical protein
VTDIASSSAPGPERTTVVGAIDLYREVHKGVRHALFDLTYAAGRADVADDVEVGALVDTCRRAVELVRAHHDHEDQLLLRALVATHAPDLAGRVDDEHRSLATRLDGLAYRADELAASPSTLRDAPAHALYLEAAAVTSACLEHLDVEERLVMPALIAACDDEHLARTHGALIAGIRAEDHERSLAVTLPALRPSERAALVDRVRASASPDAVARVRAAAIEVLTPSECAGIGFGDLDHRECGAQVRSAIIRPGGDPS